MITCEKQNKTIRDTGNSIQNNETTSSPLVSLTLTTPWAVKYLELNNVPVIFKILVALCPRADSYEKSMASSAPSLEYEAVDISERLSKLSQREDLSSSRKLYIDILNYGTDFFPLNKPWSMSNALGRVTAFVASARKAGFVDIKCFIDDSTPSNEAERKWRTRREKEVSSGLKRIPQGLTILLGDMLQRCGVEIHYSSLMDNDDTLAFYAGEKEVQRL